MNDKTKTLIIGVLELAGEILIEIVKKHQTNHPIINPIPKSNKEAI